jgi:tripartite-type tricarboxylate transporter receptor subunit TctC
MKVIVLAFAAVFTSLLPVAAMAQSGAAAYPNRPIRIVVTLAPGGPTDLFARMFSTYLSSKYNQPAPVENKPGAGQLLAAEYVARSPADGYTLLASSSNLPDESLLNKESHVDTTKDILPFGIFAGTGLFTCVNPSVPARNMAEFVAWLKANPGKLNYGTAGAPVIAWEGMRDRLGLNWVVVNYKGGALAWQAVLSGEVQMYTCDVNQSLQPMKEGRLRILSYSGRQRHPAMPDIPTFAESGIGLPDFYYFVWLGMFAPAGMPNDIAVKLNADVNAMSAGADAMARFSSMGWTPVPLGLEAVRADSAREVKEVTELLAKGVKLR